MQVFVTNLQNTVVFDTEKIKDISKRLLKYLGKTKDLSIAFVDDKKIIELNKRYRKKDSVTDVLSFGMHKANLLGDVVISVDTAKRNSFIYHSTLDEELILYIIHGILHLSGYDDATARDRRVMEKKQRELLKYVSVQDHRICT